MPNSAGGVVVERSVPWTGKPRWRRECGERAPSARKLNAWVASIPRIESITGGGKSHIMCAITVSAGPWPTPARLFEVFQQLLRGAVGLKRTGVDHASAKKSVQRDGGRVWAEGKRGVGATSHFVLPRDPVRGKSTDLGAARAADGI